MGRSLHLARTKEAKVKLLFAIKRLASAVGGAERVFCTVCSELVNRGHEVTALTYDPPDEQPFYSLDPRVRRINLDIGDPSQPAGLIETLVRMRALRRVINAEQPDVAVGFMHSMFVPLAFALAGTGVPAVGSEHIVPEHYQTRRLQYLLLMLASPFLDKLSVLSQAILSKYPVVVRKRMVEMPNPVEAATRLANVGGTNESFTILSVGRLEAQKDHATLLRSFALIAHRFPHWRLKIVGEGVLRSDLARLIETLDLQAKVNMPGVTSAIVDEYMAAEIFVISSRYEAFGLVTAEAMSHGLPVVGFADCPGTNELIDAGKTGLLVAPGSDRVSALASALSQLMADPSLRKSLGKAGREAIKTRFSLEQVCDQWESLLHSTIRKT